MNWPVNVYRLFILGLTKVALHDFNFKIILICLLLGLDTVLSDIKENEE